MMTDKLNSRTWYPFREIMMHPEVRAAGDKVRCDASEPDWIDHFQGLCGLCQMAGPETDLTLDQPVMARQGVIVFYSWGGQSWGGQSWVDEIVQEAWTLTVELGGEGAYFRLSGAGYEHEYVFTDDDVVEMPDVMDILDKSYWRPINA